MNTPRINIRHQPGHFYPNEKTDQDWIGEHRQELLDKYGNCVILVFQREVIGTGSSIQEALEDAERHLPSEVTPVIYHLARRNPFFRVRPIEFDD